MNVVPAGMHHSDFHAGGIAGLHLAREWQSGVLRHRQGIELGAKHHGWSPTVSENRDDTVSANPGRDFVAELLQLGRETLCGCGLVKRELGVLVKMDVQCFRCRVGGVDLAIEAAALLRVRCIGRKNQRQRHERVYSHAA